MQREEMLAVVVVILLLVATVTLSDELISGKTLHRERRVLVFEAGAVLQVGSNLRLDWFQSVDAE
jgi:hypothetical protein